MNPYTKEQQERMSVYYAELRGRISKLGKERAAIGELLIKDAENDYHYWEADRPAKLRSYFWRRETLHIRDVFSGDDYLILELLLGDVNAAIFKKMWDRSTLYPYSQGFYRRPFRTEEESRAYLDLNLSRLREAIRFAAIGGVWQPETVVSKLAEFPYLCDYIAYELDQGNSELLERLRKVVNEDNSSGLLSRNMIKGMLMSRNPEAHELVGALLKAAKRQEGLRQTIAESMDETSLEGFMYILGIMIQEEMWRFSSIVRAFDVWTGLGLDAMKPAVVKKCLTAAYDALTNAEIRERDLIGEDVQLLYIALWATAFQELANAKRQIVSIAQTGPKYWKIAALQFLTQCQAPGFQHAAAHLYLKDPDLEVAGWAVKNVYPDVTGYQLSYNHLNESAEGQGSPKEWELFGDLRHALDRMAGKEMKLKGNGLFADAMLSADEICSKMLAVAHECGDIGMFGILLDYKDKMQADTRASVLRLGVSKSVHDVSRPVLLSMLGDKGAGVRRVASEAALQLELTQGELRGVEELLQYRAGDIRKTAIQLLSRQSKAELISSIGRLLSDKKEEKRLGGLDLVLSLQSNAEVFEPCAQMVREMTQRTARESILIDQIVGKDTELYGPDNGYGLYDPNESMDFGETDAASETKKSLLGRLFVGKPSYEGLEDIFASKPAQLYSLLVEWSRLIDQHREYEYEVELYDGSHEKRVLGTMQWSIMPFSNKNRDDGRQSLDHYPLADEWRKLAVKQGLNAARLNEVLFYFEASGRSAYEWDLGKVLKRFPIPAVEKWYDVSAIGQFERLTETLPYARLIRHLFVILSNEMSREESFETSYKAALDVYESLKEAIAKHHRPLTVQEVIFPVIDHRYYYDPNQEFKFEDIAKAPEIRFWIHRLQEITHMDDRFFEAGFKLLYKFARINEWEAHEVLDLALFARALELGIVTENEMYAELLGRPAGAWHLQALHRDQDRKSLSAFPKAESLVDKAVQRIVEIELKRGDSDTPVSRLAQKLERFKGMRHMVQCLLGLGQKDSLSRGYHYYWGEKTKKEMISHLLKACYPEEGEDAETLRTLLQGHAIKDQRLIDVAMYAPQWVNIIEQYLGWEGLAKTCWYFHAHVSDHFSREKETIVARYSPISPVDLNEGAFDIEWFRDAYLTIGEKRFLAVYDSAKYISEGANHRRSQLFADAVLGKLDAAELELDLSAKRNKNHVLCYGLIPLPEENRQQTLVHRYETLQKFAKESKQFGAQRRDSETKAVRLALDNLARTAGFSDSTRLTWRVEAEQFKQIAACFEPTPVADWQVSLSVDEQGKASLHISKDGKVLSTVPDKLKKNETVLALKDVQKRLKDQHGRAREALEKAMVMEEPFTYDELRILRENLVIAPLLNALVFRTEHRLGYLTADGLQDLDGEPAYLEGEEKVWIAHPAHLLRSGLWAAYQRDLMVRKAVQPFKQIFRELYVPNEDERQNGMTSGRYAGHQIQPRKAAALLKSRQWTISLEEGLQKVYHKQDVIATMYAMADWFSPAEVEAPTIEEVAFFRRREGTPMPIADIPPVLFSEIMRDIDLVVSVAHVGGVDPEASLSTVEMRAALVRELLPLLKLENVRVEGSHAKIAGSLGEYTVHLGSGVVHRMAAGALNIVPVHSQHRGKLFLPFVDEDPRTAEIVSKVLLLAEDRKIKDPTILRQLRENG